MTIEVMKQALEALELYQSKSSVQMFDVAAKGLRAAIETAEKKEPVAWMYDLKQRGSFEGVSTEYSRVKLSIGENWVPLYTAPRQWQGLTDDELWVLWNSHTEQPFPEWFVDFKRAYEVIEAKLKEKNT